MVENGRKEEKCDRMLVGGEEKGRKNERTEEIKYINRGERQCNGKVQEMNKGG